MVQKENRKILLHSCCAICSGYPVEMLKNQGYEVIVYFYNPNIYPENEYYKRLEAERALCKHFGVKLIEENYNEDEFLHYIILSEKIKRLDKIFPKT